MTDPRWLEWARRLQAVAQNGLAYTDGPFDRERYEEIGRIAIEMAALRSGADPEMLRGLYEREEGYATPKIDVRGVAFRDGAILLVKERADGLWTLPGGWADVGESPSEAVQKEVREESGFEARAVKLLAVYDRRRHPHPPMPFHAYKMFFRCELVGGGPSESIETAGTGFFLEDEVPELSTPRVTRGQLHRMFGHLRRPHLPTDFD